MTEDEIIDSLEEERKKLEEKIDKTVQDYSRLYEIINEIRSRKMMRMMGHR